MRRLLLALAACLATLNCLVALAAPAGTTVTAVELRSTQSGVQPFTLGLAFAKGDVPAVPALALSESQVVVKTRWNDGSVKFAIGSGHAALVAGQPRFVAVSAAATAPAGTPLTSADIQTANPSASVALGAIGTVTLTSLLATPVRTWISGPEMVEAHYRGVPGGDANLAVWFHVRYYKSGRTYIRAIVENGRIDITGANRSYVPSVVIGGALVFNNAGLALNHYAHTRWSQDAWIGADVPVHALLDTAYLVRSRLLPNYMNTTPSGATLNGLWQTYIPFQPGNWTPNMGDTGYQDQIGLLPRWDALYIASHGDDRAWRAVLANARALSSYAIVWVDSVTHETATPSARPNWTIDGPNQGGSSQVGAGSLVWEVAHHGSGGYLAYLLTGDYYYLQTMADQAALCYFITTSSAGSGTARLLRGQTRGLAWTLRTLSQYVAIAPAGDAIANDFRNLLANNMTHWASIVDGLSATAIGYFYEYSIDLYAPGTIAPWQQHFLMQSLGAGSDLEPLANMSAFLRARDGLYRGVVGIMGTSAGYCFNYASTYLAKISNGGNNDPASWYPSWGQIFAATQGSAPCGNALLGESGGAPSAAAGGYWGNLMPALAYAVDHHAPGAQEAWGRLTSASNWTEILNSGFDSVPNWGIVPRAAFNPDTLFANSFENSL